MIAEMANSERKFDRKLDLDLRNRTGLRLCRIKYSAHAQHLKLQAAKFPGGEPLRSKGEIVVVSK